MLLNRFPACIFPKKKSPLFPCSRFLKSKLLLESHAVELKEEG